MNARAEGSQSNPPWLLGICRSWLVIVYLRPSISSSRRTCCRNSIVFGLELCGEDLSVRILVQNLLGTGGVNF
jgi:hypothetical protein